MLHLCVFFALLDFMAMLTFFEQLMLTLSSLDVFDLLLDFALFGRICCFEASLK